MGSVQSSQDREEEDDDDEEEEDETRNNNDGVQIEARDLRNSSKFSQKVLEQEPEILPCHASASPLSPQISTVGTPRLGPSIKVWDPCNVLLPPSPAAPSFCRDFSMDLMDSDRITEVFLINHGECMVNLRSDLVGGRWPVAGLTANGERQARALAVFLKSQGVRFDAVYSSPLDRARSTASLICHELNFSEVQIQPSDAVTEMSQGLWEGCLRSEIYTPEMSNFIETFQPDFSAPSGESLRQVEIRMIEFLNNVVLRMHEKMRARCYTAETHSNPDQERGNFSHFDTILRFHRQNFSRKKSGKSRLQYMTTGDHDNFDEFTPLHANLSEPGLRNPLSVIGVFTHAIPIKCLVTSILGCNPTISKRICIDDSSSTVLRHTIRTGWQIKRLNDTSHLRLL